MGYVITGYVKNLGHRDTLSLEMSLEDVKQRKKQFEKELKNSIPKHQWAEKLKIVKVN